ncbi:MAG: hypothetical protein M1165_02790 [Candidatus Pacearchaeota archaeon]|nr:hypothetical protein [Candidatus Pacearchaeota archaeon]MDE1848869.1 hypothetical protein [Nanoarchaeota archaeon]
MKLKYAIPSLMFGAALSLFGAQKSFSKSFIELLPEPPVSEVMVPDSMTTGIEIPQGLEKRILRTPVENILPNISIAKTVYPFSINLGEKETLYGPKEILSVYFLTAGQLTFPQDAGIEYSLRARAMVNSPYLDVAANDRNYHFLIFIGYDQNRTVTLQELAKQTPEQIVEMLNPKQNRYGFSGGLELAIDALNVKQAVTFGAEVYNLYSNAGEPASRLFFVGKLGNEVSPYFAISAESPLHLPNQSSGAGEVGIAFGKDPSRTIVVYAGARASPTSFSLDSGTRFLF